MFKTLGAVRSLAGREIAAWDFLGSSSVSESGNGTRVQPT